MRLTQLEIQRLFAPGELILSGGGRRKYRITDILSNRLKIQPTQAKTPSSLSYKRIEVVIEGFPKIDPKSIAASTLELLTKHGVTDTKNEVYLYGFAKEYLMRSSNGFEMMADIDLDTISSKPVNEGQKKLVTHIIRERKSKLIRLAKTKTRKQYGHLFCELCDFNLKNDRKYGDAIIEGHHLIPISELENVDDNTIANIALLCPNCHQMIHRYMCLFPSQTFTKGNMRPILHDEFLN
jgi:hypothetical protein